MFRNLSGDGLGIAGRLSEQIELALSFGFQGLSLDLVEFQAQVARHGLPLSRRLIESSRLKIGTWRLRLELAAEDESFDAGLARASELAKLAGEIGAERALLRVSPTSDRLPYHANFELHRRRLDQLGSMLKPFGIKVGLEFSAIAEERAGGGLEFLHSLDALALLVGMVASDQIGVALDFWQMHVAGNSLDDLRKLPPSRWISVTLSDAPLESPANGLSPSQRLLIGETGVIDECDCLRRLADRGYHGPVAVAADRSATQSLGREPLVKLAGERLSSAWKLAGVGAMPARALAGQR